MKRNALKHHKIGFPPQYFLILLGDISFLISVCMLCVITRKSRASIRGKLHHYQTYMRHFSQCRKYTACSSRDSLVKVATILQRSSLGTRGLQTTCRSHRQKKQTTAFLESRSAKASSTNKSNIKFVMLFGVLMKELLQDE